jgi:hypothetical protein
MRGGQAPRTAYRVALVTEDGTIPLTAVYSGGRVNDDRCREIRSTINKMLDVHLASEDDNDIRQLALSRHEYWAGAMVAERNGLNATKAHQFVERLIAESDRRGGEARL